MKKLPNALAAATFLAPMGVAALGVGDIELKSALNQPLNANISLVASRSESSSDIKVSLASPEAFRRAGIERHFYLSNIRFKPVVAADGSLSVKVTSHDIIREPFLNFLVEVNWPQGRALKEFTVLLDPPVTLREAEPVIQRAPVARRVETKSSSAKMAEGHVRAPVDSGTTGSSSSVLPALEFGPTRKNDTLWAVAKQVNQDASISQEQMMMSLYKKNPHAFYQKNVNALKRGQTLQVPSREEAFQLSKGEARRAFSEHYKVWTAKTTQKESDEIREEKVVSDASSSLSETQESDQLTLLTPTDDMAASAAGLSEQDSGAGGNAEPMADMAIEMAETVRQENEEIQKRMAALEEQVATMQRLLVLKDEQLAALQGSQADEPVVSEESTETIKESGAGAEIAVETPEPEELQTTEPPPQEPSFFEDPVILAAGGVGVLVLALVAIALRRKQAIEEDMAVAESILVATDESPDSNDELIAPVVDSSESEAGIPAESSFLSEFTPSDFDTLESDGDEVDPITEADVYLAYGRYQQAEDLVRQAIESDPGNDEYKLKLLEIHFATEDKTAFLSLAKEIHADCSESNPDVWMRALEMGQDLCPEEPLFQIGESDVSEVEESSEVLSSEPITDERPLEDEITEVDLDLDLESDAFNENETAETEEPVSDSQDGKTEASNSLEFDFDEVAELDGTQDEGEGKADSSDSEDEVESNLIDFGTVESIEAPIEAGLDIAESTSASEESESKDEGDDFGFDFEMVSPEAEEPAKPAVQEESLDLDFDDDIAASLTDMDEVETKLDLAKAYVDMEDGEAAKAIIQEVIEQGNDEQKAEAQALMDGLTGE